MDMNTVVAMDKSCSVATDGTWLIFPVPQGSVVYVAAEGQAGITARGDAPELAHCTQISDTHARFLV
jgi:hypothetical protein